MLWLRSWKNPSAQKGNWNLRAQQNLCNSTFNIAYSYFKWSGFDYVPIPKVKHICFQIQLLPKIWDVFAVSAYNNLYADLCENAEVILLNILFYQKKNYRKSIPAGQEVNSAAKRVFQYFSTSSSQWGSGKVALKITIKCSQKKYVFYLCVRQLLALGEHGNLSCNFPVFVLFVPFSRGMLTI